VLIAQRNGIARSDPTKPRGSLPSLGSPVRTLITDPRSAFGSATKQTAGLHFATAWKQGALTL